MDIKKTFLKLTEYTIPHGMEHTLKKYLPKGIIEDGVGNYYIRIGESRTIFTSHMDTACGKYEKVNHMFTGPMIHTDGKTVLSGDDKNGMTIMLYMISKNVPGTYYFFQGEESGLVGANAAKRKNKAFFEENFDRMVSFDRRGYESIITHQLGRRGCTEEFSAALSEEFGYHGMRFKSDSGGIYTDSEVFIRVIPEVTNLSCGYFREHSRDEVTNIEFLEDLAKAACLIKWEELPIGKMDPKEDRFNDWSDGWGWGY